ncbi:amidase [Rhizobium azibense]|uniref:Aspartyl-tRNA(Asn)/glutamyl-tRNA(Gln) amidotransferase subunit A n=1 Tax=Rhizobium azibense TaxID=1136135 RepID=A0A4V2VD57_9HYPH|nr:amidase [Rhizobium azibense]TCU31465.1 aspartyl-tRNA(Asn)/glutamyl-tRNA(Gln) amidotransferase subunit A [Rhizobium azibense]
MLRQSSSTIRDMTACEAVELLRQRRISPLEIANDCLNRIDEINPSLNAFCWVDRDGALKAARLSEERWFRGAPLGALDGIPATIKDLTLTIGMPTRRGSATTSDAGPWNVDAPVSARLREAGAILVGKTTSPEFGWKGVTDSPLFGVTRNPWDKELTPGGSSGGAGVAAALNLGMLHQGSDAGGSIRIPASFTGTFGFKPTFGYVAQWPESAMRTLSHLGPMTRTVPDAELMMTVISGRDPRDGFSGPDYPKSIAVDLERLEGCRIAYSADLGYVDVSEDIRRVTDAAVEQARALGAIITEIDPGFSDPIDTIEVLWCAGAARVLRSLDDQQAELLDPGFREMAQRGLNISLAEYQAAEMARSELAAQMSAFHQEHEFLLTPTMPLPPFPVGRVVPDPSIKKWAAWTPFTYPFNLTQQPAASLASGLDAKRLPVGLQVVGARHNDRRLLSVCRILEKQLGRLVPPCIARFHHTRPRARITERCLT